MSRFSTFAFAAMITASLAPMTAYARSNPPTRPAISVASYDQKSTQSIPTYRADGSTHSMPVGSRHVGAPLSDSTGG